MTICRNGAYWKVIDLIINRNSLRSFSCTDADAEEIALAACEVSHNIQSSAAYLQGIARHDTKLLEDSAAKLHALSLTEIRDWKFTHHTESTPQIRMPYFRLCGSQVVERTCF